MSRHDDREPDEDAPLPGEPVRLDKWLWAARFYKTRSMAAEAVAGGKVHVNGERARPARIVRAGDVVALRLGPYDHTVVVRALSARRGPATVARELYAETPESIAARERLASQLRYEGPVFEREAGRPSKKDRRQLSRLRDRRRGG